MSENFRFGFVAIIGKPNVGKSTLMNQLIGHKISITSKRPQTTRHRILGIFTDEQRQIVFVDTPGIHLGRKGALNRYMNQAASSALNEVDVLLWLVVAGQWTPEDAKVLSLVQCGNTLTVGQGMSCCHQCFP